MAAERRRGWRVRSQAWRYWIAITVVVLSACDHRSGASNLRMLVRDSAGITIIEHHPGEAGTRWLVSAAPTLEIGAVAGDAAYQLSRIVGVRRLPDGTIIVANANPPELRFYGPDGAHLRTAGRAGSGPGEFRSISGIVAADDSILVFDGNLRRISVFDQEGRFGGAAALEAPQGSVQGLFGYGLAGLTAEGHLLLVPVGFSPRLDGMGISWVTAGPALLYDRRGMVVDSVGETLGADSFSTAEFATIPPFGRFGRAVYGGGHLYVTDGGMYEVRVYERSPIPSVIIRWNRESRPVTTALVEQWREQRLAATPEDARAEALAMLRQIEAPETVPWIMDLALDARDFLWVREYSLPRDREITWSIFAPSGQLLGSVGLPSELQVREVGEDYVLGVWRDDLGVEYIRMYELTRGAF